MLDNALRNLVHCEFKIGKFQIAFLDVLLAVCITFVGIQIRIPIFGALGNLGIEGGIHQTVYCVLDFILAFLMGAFIWKNTENKLKVIGVYSLTIIWPVFAANSAMNGGNEVIGAVIILVLLMFVNVSKISPNVGFGLLTIATCGFQILQGDGSGNKLTNCWPNVYTLFGENGYVMEYGYAGKLFVLGALIIIFYYISKKSFRMSLETMLCSGLFFSLFITFFYPFMNYRSGFLANVFGLLLFVHDKRKFYIPMSLCIISYVSYALYHNGEIGVFYWIYALGILALIMDTGVNFYKQIHIGK